MNLGVLVKASLDVNMIRVDSEGRILLDAIPLAISEYDRNAVAEAVRIKEEKGGKIYAFSVLTWGPANKRAGEIENVLREALALGADEAHVVIDDSILPADINATAEALATLIKKTGDFQIRRNPGQFELADDPAFRPLHRRPEGRGAHRCYPELAELDVRAGPFADLAAELVDEPGAVVVGEHPDSAGDEEHDQYDESTPHCAYHCERTCTQIIRIASNEGTFPNI